MAAFDDKSRYRGIETYQATDRRGRTVSVVAVPAPPVQGRAGYHRWRQGQRLDHMASHYLDDPAGFWRIAEENGAMLAESLAERREVAIPTRSRR